MQWHFCKQNELFSNLNKIKSRIFKPAGDCGCKKNKVEGLLSNSAMRRGIGHPRPLIKQWVAQIRKGKGEGEVPSGTVAAAVAQPLPAARRSSTSGKQGLRAMIR